MWCICIYLGATGLFNSRALAQAAGQQIIHDIVLLIPALHLALRASAIIKTSLIADRGLSHVQNQMCVAFARVKQELTDIQLDCPGAAQQFKACQDQAVAEGWLS